MIKQGFTSHLKQQFLQQSTENFNATTAALLLMDWGFPWWSLEVKVKIEELLETIENPINRNLLLLLLAQVGEGLKEG